MQTYREEAPAGFLRGAVTWHVGRQLVFLGPELSRELGLDAAGEVRGHRVEDYFARVHPDDQEAMSAAALRCYGEGSPLSLRYRLIDRNGEIRCVEFEGAWTYGEDTMPETMYGYIHPFEEELDATPAEELAWHALHIKLLVDLHGFRRLKPIAELLAMQIETMTRERERTSALLNPDRLLAWH